MTTPIPHRSLLVGLFTMIASVAFESYAVTTAMPYVAADLGYIEWYAWASSAFMMAMVTTIVIGGRVCDSRGPVPALGTGLVLFFGGLALAGGAGHMAILLAARVIQGLGAGLVSVSLYVLIAEAYDETQRPRVLVWISAAWVLPSLLGPPIAGWVAGHWGWQWAFWGLLPLLALAGVLVWRPMMRLDAVEHTPPERPIPVWAGIGLGAAIALVQLAGQELRWWSVPLAAGGIAAIVVCLPPTMPAGFVRFGRGLPAVIGARMLVPGTFYVGEYFIPLMLSQTHQISPRVAGVVLSVGATGWLVGSWVQSRDWSPPRERLIVIGAIAVGAGLTIVAVVSALPWLWFGITAIGWALGGLGMGLLVTTTTVLTMDLSAPTSYGRNSTSLQVAENLGASMSLAAAGTIFAFLHPRVAAIHTYWPMLAVMIGVALFGALLARRVPTAT